MFVTHDPINDSELSNEAEQVPKICNKGYQLLLIDFCTLSKAYTAFAYSLNIFTGTRRTRQ